MKTWQSVLLVMSVIGGSVTLLTQLWPAIEKTAYIYSNVDTLKDKMIQFDSVADVLISTGEIEAQLLSRVQRVEGQNHQLREENTELRNMIRELAIGTAPFDSVWIRDEFGAWNRFHVKDYYDPTQ